MMKGDVFVVMELKNIFPNLYDYYQHLNRRKIISEIEKMKAGGEEEYPRLLAEKYFLATGRLLDWNNLSTYCEKMQWAKLYDLDDRKTLLSDKFLVRDWIAKKIGDKYLIPLLGVWNTFDEIDFDELPSQFVLKTNHASGFNLIVNDKSKIKRRQVKRLFDDWMDIDFSLYMGFEMQYSNIERKIIAEKYIQTIDGDLPDYKFLCFDGTPFFCWVDKGRYENHTRNIYDMNWSLQPWRQANKKIYEKPIEKPVGFDQMRDLAATLSKGFSHVRVDFYNVEGRIFFGEMTFSNGCGFDLIYPEEANLMLGNLWKLDGLDK